MRLVCTGGRHFENQNLAEGVLFTLKPEEVFVGDCPSGLDLIVREYCKIKNIRLKIFTADWDSLGRSAGPTRNGHMLFAAGDMALVIAFPGGRGTADCVRQAKARGMLVLEVK